MKEKVIELLKSMEWQDAGYTPIQSYRTTTIAFPGSVVTLGGRVRLRRRKWTVTIGERTTIFSLKPDNPETIMGQGRMAGKTIYTFRDWEQYSFKTKDIADIEARAKEIEARTKEIPG